MLRKTFRNDPDLLTLFFLAESLGKTVDEVLTGRPNPLSNGEFTYWQAYWKVKNEVQERESKKKGSKSAPEGPRIKKTMGS